MGLIYAEIELANSGDIYLAQKGFIKKEEIKKVTVKALVDSGAYMMAINEEICEQLDLPFIEEQSAILADGQEVQLKIVGPVEIRFLTRSTTARAIVLPGDAEVLLGSIPMEDLDVVLNMKDQTLTLPPDRPFMAQKSLK